jgi:hypothetical protein
MFDDPKDRTATFIDKMKNMSAADLAKQRMMLAETRSMLRTNEARDHFDRLIAACDDIFEEIA